MTIGRFSGVAVAVAVLACVPGWAAVTITQPGAADSIWQFVDVAGTATPGATVTVSFSVTRAGQDAPVYEAPPTLEKADQNGIFRLRLSLPPITDRQGLQCTVTAGEVGPVLAEHAQVAVAMAATALAATPLDPAIPTITSPVEGSQVGPGVMVEGRATVGQVVIILTKCFDTSTGTLIKDVPGMRHLPKEDGSFALKVATPRASVLGQNVNTRYEIRAFSATPEYQSPAIYVHVNAEPRVEGR